jgi:DNA-directed RNA polymerase subunit RPC12/RpoP
VKKEQERSTEMEPPRKTTILHCMECPEVFKRRIGRYSRPRCPDCGSDRIWARKRKGKVEVENV